MPGDPTVPVDILLYFFMWVAIIMIPCIYTMFLFAERKYWMGSLGRAEYRNKNGILGVIASLDGFVGIEKMAFYYPGVLKSLAATPKFGKYFFAGKDSVLKPVAGIRVAVIMAKDALAGSLEAMALAETMRGDFKSTSDEMDARLEALADQEAKATAGAQKTAVVQGASGKQVAAQEEKPRPKSRYIFRRGGKERLEKSAKFEGQDVPVFKNIDEACLFWCETRYFPSRQYVRKVDPKSEAQRRALQAQDPAAFAIWRQAYIDDQVEAILAKTQLDNERAVMVEIQTGVLRKTTSLEKYDMDADGLTVKPVFSTVQETKPIDKKTRTAWFNDKFAEWAKDTKYWAKDVGGRTVNVTALADFKLTNFGQGQVNDMLQNERNIMNDEQSGRDAHLFKMVLAAVVLICGVALAFYILTH